MYGETKFRVKRKSNKMKIERWEEESEEEWAERLAEEIALANDTETSQYFVNRDPYDEAGVIVNYIGKDGWMWKEHPEGPFTAKQIIGWKNEAEKFDRLRPGLEYLAQHADKVIDILRSSTPSRIEG